MTKSVDHRCGGSSGKRGAQSNVVPGFTEKMAMWFRHHQQELKKSFRELLATPATSLMTLTVLAIALALPAGLQVMLKNFKQLTPGFDHASRISLYLKLNATDTAVQKLVNNLSIRQDILHVELITPRQGLKQFETRSGFGNALQYLDKNPLPYVLTITPSASYASVETAQTLLSELKKLVLVDKAQLDLEWIKRLQAIMLLAQKAVEALGAIFALAVILVVGNTIRLAIQNRQDEIKVIKLVGATNSFIRRPFLYSGIWFGLGGAFLAWMMVMLTLQFLRQPVSHLAQTYSSNFQLQGMSINEVFILLGVGALLGWLGSWVAVTRHIHKIEPG